MTHCGQKGCRCTHTQGCEYGWVQLQPYTHPETRQTYEPVGPCPICRPNAYDRMVGSITRGSVKVK